jgi:hypothetical protein
VGLACLLRAAETDKSLTPCFIEREAGAYAFIGVQGDVCLEFGREVVAAAASD